MSASAVRDPGASRPDWEAALEPSALGLDDAAELPFDYWPGATESPLLLSFPHVGLSWPAEIDPRPQVSFARNADFEVDAIYPPPGRCPAARVRARFSRLLVDLNRADDDVSARLVPDHPSPRPRAQAGGGAANGIENRGVLWTHAVGRIPILRELSYADFEARLDRYHRPYHRAIQSLLDARVQRFGYAILLDAHSMPSAVPRDLVLGTLDGASCSEALQNAAHAALDADEALACALNRPYRGGEIVRRFGRPDHKVHALQLEVNRGLYMDELRLQLHVDGSEAQNPAGRGHPAAPKLLAAIGALVDLLADPNRHSDLNVK